MSTQVAKLQKQLELLVLIRFVFLSFTIVTVPIRRPQPQFFQLRNTLIFPINVDCSGGTGAVGKTVAQLIVGLGGDVIVSSRKKQRSVEVCQQLVKQGSTEAKLIPLGTDEAGALEEALPKVQAIFGCGAAGIELLTLSHLAMATSAKVAVDLNAVPPAGISGIQVTDHATDRKGRFDYGALALGDSK